MFMAAKELFKLHHELGDIERERVRTGTVIDSREKGRVRETMLPKGERLSFYVWGQERRNMAATVLEGD